MEPIRDEELLQQGESVSKTRHRAPNIYANTVVDGNARLMQGDNYGSINHYYGDHYHHALPRGGTNVKGVMSDEDKTNALLRSLAFDEMGFRLRNVGPALMTTCQWLRSHYTFASWLGEHQSPESYGLLWIKGKPGSGKSTTMKETLLWAEAEYPQRTFISYFFDARSHYQLAKSTLGMYRSLLHQLVSSQTGNCELFMKEFSLKIKDSGIEDWSETEIQNFLINLANTQNLSTLTIFVDALDEDDGDDVQEMVGFFEDLQHRVMAAGGTLRICLSSRHYPHISIRGTPIVLEEQSGHERDIRKYIRTRLLGKDSLEKSEFREKIVKMAAGVFLWVILMTQILNREFNRGKGLASMHHQLDCAPRGVRNLFTAILAKEEENKEECIILLRWVLYAERPLRPAELYAAVRYTSTGVIGEECDAGANISDYDYDHDEETSNYLLYCSRGLWS